VSQLQGVHQGRSCGRPPRALGNEEDGMASAFPKGKQNEKSSYDYISSVEDILNCGKYNKNDRHFKTLLLFFILFTIN
jgi:hypothetical protein